MEYDRRISGYNNHSFVGVDLRGAFCPIICLETVVEPFDTCLIAELGSSDEVLRLAKQSFKACHFIVADRGSSGKLIGIDKLQW